MEDTQRCEDTTVELSEGSRIHLTLFPWLTYCGKHLDDHLSAVEVKQNGKKMCKVCLKARPAFYAEIYSIGVLECGIQIDEQHYSFGSSHSYSWRIRFRQIEEPYPIDDRQFGEIKHAWIGGSIDAPDFGLVLIVAHGVAQYVAKLGWRKPA